MIFKQYILINATKLQRNLFLFFLSLDIEVKDFRHLFEAIDFDFVLPSYHLLKIILQNIQKMMVPKDAFLQTWQDVCIFLVWISLRQNFSFFNFSSSWIFFSKKKKNLSKFLDQLNLVAHFREYLHLFAI